MSNKGKQHKCIRNTYISVGKKEKNLYKINELSKIKYLITFIITKSSKNVKTLKIKNKD